MLQKFSNLSLYIYIYISVCVCAREYIVVCLGPSKFSIYLSLSLNIRSTKTWCDVVLNEDSTQEWYSLQNYEI